MICILLVESVPHKFYFHDCLFNEHVSLGVFAIPLPPSLAGGPRRKAAGRRNRSESHTGNEHMMGFMPHGAREWVGDAISANKFQGPSSWIMSYLT